MSIEFARGQTAPFSGGLLTRTPEARQRRAKGKAARGTAEADALARQAGLDRAPRNN